MTEDATAMRRLSDRTVERHSTTYARLAVALEERVAGILSICRHLNY
jgi:hypothetical protein